MIKRDGMVVKFCSVVYVHMCVYLCKRTEKGVGRKRIYQQKIEMQSSSKREMVEGDGVKMMDRISYYSYSAHELRLVSVPFSFHYFLFLSKSMCKSVW